VISSGNGDFECEASGPLAYLVDISQPDEDGMVEITGPSEATININYDTIVPEGFEEVIGARPVGWKDDGESENGAETDSPSISIRLGSVAESRLWASAYVETLPSTAEPTHLITHHGSANGGGEVLMGLSQSGPYLNTVSERRYVDCDDNPCPDGTLVLKALPYADYTFLRWKINTGTGTQEFTNNPKVYYFDSPVSAEAIFEVKPLLDFEIEIVGGDSETPTPCIGYCTADPAMKYYDKDEIVEVTAHAQPGYCFVRWWEPEGKAWLSQVAAEEGYGQFPWLYQPVPLNDAENPVMQTSIWIRLSNLNSGDAKSRTLRAQFVEDEIFAYEENFTDLTDGASPKIYQLGYNILEYMFCPCSTFFYVLAHGHKDPVNGFDRFSAGEESTRIYASDFPAGSQYQFVFMNCCYSLCQPGAGNFANSMGVGTTGVYLGWSIIVYEGVAEDWGPYLLDWLNDGRSVDVALSNAKTTARSLSLLAYQIVNGYTNGAPNFDYIRNGEFVPDMTPQP